MLRWRPGTRLLSCRFPPLLSLRPRPASPALRSSNARFTASSADSFGCEELRGEAGGGDADADAAAAAAFFSS
uniref:Uncharacterized protein n=1 Tax=Leersia perrieri TaxID=77586 RepID=A0A0D9WSZ5_9ORYZ